MAGIFLSLRRKEEIRGQDQGSRVPEDHRETAAVSATDIEVIRIDGGPSY